MWTWDYKIPENWQPTTDQEWEWLLVRKVNYGDVKGLKKDILKKYFHRIKNKLDPGKRAMLENFFNNKNKTLRKRDKLLGLYIDSLEDIAANKTFAYFDRNEPKDLFDIYFFISKGGFTPQKLLALAHQKFGVKFNENSFWSEAFKSLPLLKNLKPLMVQRSQEDQEKLLKEIQDYFKRGSEEFLRKNLT